MSATAVVEGSAVPTPRSEVRATAQEQTDAILRVVSEAARQLCGSQVALIDDRAGRFIDDIGPLLWVVVDRGAAHSAQPLHILPSLIDLPPPLR